MGIKIRGLTSKCESCRAASRKQIPQSCGIGCHLPTTTLDAYAALWQVSSGFGSTVGTLTLFSESVSIVGFNANLSTLLPAQQEPGGRAPKSSQADAFMRRAGCGADWAQKHSIAAALGVQNTVLGQMLGGNSVASAATTALQLMDPHSGDAPDFRVARSATGSLIRRGAFNGFAQAVTGANAQLTSLPLSASGAALAQGAEAATAEALAASASIASGLAQAKLAYDAVTFFVGFIRGCK